MFVLQVVFGSRESTISYRYSVIVFKQLSWINSNYCAMFPLSQLLVPEAPCVKDGRGAKLEVNFNGSDSDTFLRCSTFAHD